MPVAMMMNEVQNYPVEERVALADAVLQTLNPVDTAVQGKWLHVAERRRGEILSGSVRPISTAEVLSEAYARAMEWYEECDASRSSLGVSCGN